MNVEHSTFNAQRPSENRKDMMMKLYIKILVLLITVFQITNALASENITGTWQGTLVTSPGTELAIQFIITQEPDGSYSAILNSPDEGGIKNIKANSVIYFLGRLRVNVAELGGSYEGVAKDGTIDGKWEQEGTSFPLSLSLYKKSTLSKKDMDRLLGVWHGKPEIPKGPQGMVIIGNTPIHVFRFEMTEKGEFKGSLEFPETGGRAGTLIKFIEISNGSLIIELPGFSPKTEYKGKFIGNEIVGKLYMRDIPTFSLTLTKGEYRAPTYKLNLSKENIKLLLGKWSGKLGALKIVFRFETTDKGDFVGFMDRPDKGMKGVPITNANLSNGKLILKMESLGNEFKGQLSGDKLVGEWTQLQPKSNTKLSLTKEVPQI